MSQTSGFEAALKSLAKLQVDVLIRTARLAITEGEASANKNILSVLERIEVLLLGPLPPLPQLSRPDPNRIAAAVACFCVIDLFVNAKKQQTLFPPASGSSGTATDDSNGKHIAMMMATVKALADGFSSLLPNALSLLKAGKRSFLSGSNVNGGSSDTLNSNITPPAPSPATRACQQQQFTLFAKQIEPFVRQWGQTGAAAAVMSALRAPTGNQQNTNSQGTLSGADSTTVNQQKQIGDGGSGDQALPNQSENTTDAVAASPSPSTTLLRLTSSEAQHRTKVVSMIAALLSTLRLPTCPLPQYRRNHYIKEIHDLTRNGVGGGAGSIGQTAGKGERGSAKNKQKGKQHSLPFGGGGVTTNSLPLRPVDVTPKATALFETLALLHQTVTKEMAVHAENSLAASMVNTILGAVQEAGSASAEGERSIDERNEKGSGGALTLKGSKGNNDKFDDDRAGKRERDEERDAANTKGETIPATSAGKGTPLLTAEEAQRQTELARVSLLSPVTLESDVQRYLPLGLRLAGASLPNKARGGGADGARGGAGRGYNAPNTAADILRTHGACVEDTRQDIVSDRDDTRQLAALHGGLLTLSNTPSNTASGAASAVPRFRVPAALQNAFPVYAPSSGADGSVDDHEVGGGANNSFLSAQQQADGNGYLAATIALGGDRSVPFSSKGLLVFPPPEGGACAGSGVDLVNQGGAQRSVGGINTASVQTFSAVQSRRKVILEAAEDIRAQAAEEGGATKGKEREREMLLQQAAALSVQRTWMPTVDEWLHARDMAHIPMLRFRY